VGDVDHHIADPDDGDPPAHLEGPLAEAGKPVEMVDHVLRMIDAGRRVALDADRLRPLGTRGKHQRAGLQASEVFDGEVFGPADRHVPQIVHVRPFDDLPVRLPQPSP